MAISKAGHTLYPFLEGAVTGVDPASRRVFERISLSGARPGDLGSTGRSPCSTAATSILVKSR